MKERMNFMMNTLRGRVSSGFNELVHRTDSPFTASVTLFLLSPTFRMPQVKTYDASKDPLDHLESFKTLMLLQGVVDEIMRRVFPTMLKSPIKIWFSRLTPNSISTFKELSAQFSSYFIGRHRYKKSTACLMSIKQREDETLRSYIIYFNKEALLIDEADNKILVAALTNGLWKEKPKKRERQNEAWQDRGLKTTRTGDRQEDRCSKPPTGRFTSFTLLNASINQVLMQIKDEGALTFPGKLKGDPNKRSRDKYCRFYHDHNHNTSDYYDLK
ncbi:uncharacterized protein LOC115980741 [Quercus lobata]|uniref:uncharacterized protein LOC115980741 n=1 Tax=Quercus lobata TaxID=97700 RepID=UPI0012464914|nr:uncharacterized protein LOC115980741 [Quercus lobata]